jgi:ankyrin repeat protein
MPLEVLKFGHAKPVIPLTHCNCSAGNAIQSLDETDCTPLMVAAKNGNSVAFTALVTMGASPAGKDDRGRGLLSLGICSVCRMVTLAMFL